MTQSMKREVFRDDRVLLQEIVALGWSRFNQAKPDTLPSHVHTEAYEICYINQGFVEWWVDEEYCEIKGGDIFITRPGEEHGGIGGVMNPCELYWIQVRLPELVNKLNEVDGAAHFVHGFETLRFRHFPAVNTVRDCFEHLMNEHRHPTTYSALVARPILVQLLVGALRSHQYSVGTQTAPHYKMSEPVRQAIDYINNNLSRPVLVQDIAAVVSMSTSYFYQRFVQETGMTPADFRTRQRVQMAKGLLQEKELSVTQIAYQFGFSTSQYFATVFKRYTGLTPTAFRRQQFG